MLLPQLTIWRGLFCRRAERLVVRLAETENEAYPQVIAYLNRLSDLLWFFGRLLELRAGVDASVRDEAQRRRMVASVVIDRARSKINT
ncbi:MAG: ATP:cob(I)alamin adenosyltransferase [Acidobacteriota bacterium]